MAKTSTAKGRSASEIADQHVRFLKTARALGCDEDEAAFDEKLKGIAGQKLKAAPLVPEGHQQAAGEDEGPPSRMGSDGLTPNAKKLIACAATKNSDT